MASTEIITGGKEHVSKASNLLAKAFVNDPTFNYICGSLTKERRLAYFPTAFKIFLDATTKDASVISFTSDFQSCGVLIPPGHHPLPPIREAELMLRSGIHDMLWTLRWGGYSRLIDVSGQGKALKHEIFGDRETFYYIFFLGTLLEARGKGLCSKVIKHFQDLAEKAGKPIWLEAADEKCMGLYKKNGFVVVREMKIAVGKAASDGELKVGGEGFSV